MWFVYFGENGTTFWGDHYHPFHMGNRPKKSVCALKENFFCKGGPILKNPAVQESKRDNRARPFPLWDH